MAQDGSTKPTDQTPWERFIALARKVTQTPKAEIEKRDAAWRENRVRRKRGQSS
jgi:hypothetical protein